MDIIREVEVAVVNVTTNKDLATVVEEVAMVVMMVETETITRDGKMNMLKNMMMIIKITSQEDVDSEAEEVVIDQEVENSTSKIQDLIEVAQDMKVEVKRDTTMKIREVTIMKIDTTIDNPKVITKNAQEVDEAEQEVTPEEEEVKDIIIERRRRNSQIKKDNETEYR